MPKLVRFTDREKRFLDTIEGCSITTVYPDNRPHIVPVNFLLIDGLFYIASDYNTRKVKNIQLNDKVALLFATFNPNRAMIIEGEASLLEHGPEFKHIYDLFYKRFSWVRNDPWSEGEAPFIIVKPVKKIRWGLKST
ncbi:MAG: pyridoxamine 5'-phosphate oxidase family protein [Thaumarchaeota archaeon]|nr:pyridoxamine 5'-phosphate oxidase family protein [Nitrososphaerota archaeon]MCL5318366.1 pyridoxamine 5'-phosphate oxidase family protein [Nitrososphaerota archaeon]